MKRVKRLIAVSVLGVALAVLLPPMHAQAIGRPICLIPPCPTPTPTADHDHGNNQNNTPEATATATAQAQVFELPTPIPTPSLPDTGFAESNQVTQGQDLITPQLVKGPPPAIANYAAPPGFSYIGLPLLVLFALLGSGAFFLRRRL